MNTGKKLTRPTEGKVFFGVCAGLAEYFNLDVTIVRAIFMIATIFSFAGVAVYAVLALVVPQKATNND